MFDIVQRRKAKLHFDIVTLVYNASKLATDRIRKHLEANKIQLRSF